MNRSFSVQSLWAAAVVGVLVLLVLGHLPPSEATPAVPSASSLPVVVNPTTHQITSPGDFVSTNQIATVSSVIAAQTAATNYAATAATNAYANATNAAASYTTNYVNSHPGSGALVASNNLSDVPTPATARTNLGLGSAATQASTAFDAAGSATSAQAAAQSFTTNYVATNAAPISGSANYAPASGSTSYATPASVTAAQGASLQKSANLNDVATPAAARQNLGVPWNQVISVSANFTASVPGALYNVTTGTSAITVTLPTAANGLWFGVRKADSTTGTITINGARIGVAGHTEEVFCDGTTFYNRFLGGAIDASGNFTYTVAPGGNFNVATSGGGTAQVNGNTVLTTTNIGTTVQAYNASTTTQGNIFNGASQLLQADASGNLPALNGKNVTGLGNFANLTSIGASGTASPIVSGVRYIYDNLTIGGFSGLATIPVSAAGAQSGDHLDLAIYWGGGAASFTITDQASGGSLFPSSSATSGATVLVQLRFNGTNWFLAASGPLDPRYAPQSGSPYYAAASNTPQLNATHNNFPNMTGVLPVTGDMVNIDQITRSIVNGFLQPFYVAYMWQTSVTGSGTASITNTPQYCNAGTSTTNPSGGVVYLGNSFLLPLGSTASGNYAKADFSRPFFVEFTLNGNNNPACPNTTWRFTIGKNTGSFAYGAPSSIMSIGCKVVLDTASTGHFYGEVNNGTTLTISSASKYSLSFALNTTATRVGISSNGAGTVTYYINGAQVDQLTGGPTGIGGTQSNSISIECYNTADASAANLFCGVPTIYAPYQQ